MVKPELSEWVVAAQAGDRGAFEALVLRVQDMAVAVCYGRLGSVEQARDAAQDALIDSYLHLDQLQEPAAFGAWFRRILLKHCDRRTRLARPDREALSQHEGQLRDSLDAERSLIGAERERWLWAAIEELPEHERSVVALHYMADASLNDIASLLEISPNTIKQRLHSARKRLRERSLNLMSTQMHEARPSKDSALSDHVALFLAVRSGDVDTVRSLVARDASLLEAREAWDLRDWPERELPVPARGTPLIRAAEAGHAAVVRALLDAGAQVDGACGCPTDETALWAAVVTSQHATAEELLARGADPNRGARSGIRALHVAAMRGDAALLDLLLRHGADPRQRDGEGRSPADWAVIKGHDAMARRLAADASAPASSAVSSAISAASRATEPSGRPELYATGIKALDLFAPLRAGSLVLVQGGAGVGRNVLIAELADAARRRGDCASIWVMWPRELWHEAELEQLLNETHLKGFVHVLRDAPGADPQLARLQPARALELASALLRDGVRHVQLTFFERPGVRAAIDTALPALGIRPDGSAISAFIVPPLQVASESAAELKPPFDACIGFDRALASAATFPAICSHATRSRWLERGQLSAAHLECAAEARALLSDGGRAARAACLQAYLSQPFHVAEPFSGRPGVAVPIDRMLDDVRAILDGAADAATPAVLRYRGALELHAT